MSVINFVTTNTTFEMVVNGTSYGLRERTDGIHSVEVVGSRLRLDIKEPGFAYWIESTDTLQVDGVTQSGTPAQKRTALLVAFGGRAEAPATSGVPIKSDDTDAFSAISNGQGSFFEVNGEISYYAKSSNGTQKILTLPNF
jgi:hypothetical protein